MLLAGARSMREAELWCTSHVIEFMRCAQNLDFEGGAKLEDQAREESRSSRWHL